MKYWLIVFSFFVLLGAIGCTPLVVGGGAAGGYKVATDERTAGRMMDDSTITGNVKAEMVKAKDVKARNIDVDTIDGIVFLSGMVDTEGESSRAAEIAKSISGVTRVKNDLQVGTRTVGEALDDKVLGSKIKTKLIGEPGVRSLNIDIDVYQGVVILIGTAENIEQRDKVVGIAKSAPGTKKVIDNIIIK